MPDRKNIFVTSHQAAEILNVSLVTLKKFIYKGLIKTIKTPGGHHRILRNDLFELSLSCQPAEEPHYTKKTSFEIADILNKILERKQRFCRGHSHSVAKISLDIAENLDFTTHQKEKLRLGALLHDVGMLEISENILNKKDPLNEHEYTLIKMHPVYGEEISGYSDNLRQVALIVRQHHERCDGKGYPDGLEKEEICREAKIIALAEAFVCMTAADSYKETLNSEAAMRQIKENSGAQFDPAVVDAFLKFADK